MAEKTSNKGRAKTAQGPHTPASNEPEFEAAPRAPKVDPPSRGSSPNQVAPREDGMENVPGARLLTAAAEEVAPDDQGLRDIGEASFGARSTAPETVHGIDDRTKITATASYPWRVHASLLITARDDSKWIGTGWFIGPHTLVTAGHCVFIKNSGVPGRDGWVKEIRVMPGRNGSALPFGSVTSRSFRSVTGWTESGSEHYDYGAIITPTDLGSTVGWLGFGAFPDATIKGSVGNISGYPGDKPSGTQWYAARKIASVSTTKVYYDIDTAGGQSGSAVYRIDGGKRYGMAVHAYGGAVNNSGTRITSAAFGNLKAWKA